MSNTDKSVLGTGEQNQTLVPKTKTLENNAIVYKSDVMKQLMRMVEKVAPSRAD